MHYVGNRKDQEIESNRARSLQGDEAFLKRDF